MQEDGDDGQVVDQVVDYELPFADLERALVEGLNGLLESDTYQEAHCHHQRIGCCEAHVHPEEGSADGVGAQSGPLGTAAVLFPILDGVLSVFQEERVDSCFQHQTGQRIACVPAASEGNVGHRALVAALFQMQFSLNGVGI